MTEAEWLAATEPGPVLAYLDARGLLTDRKQRLHDCACVRRTWHLLVDERGRRAVETAERFADRTATRKELREAQGDAFAAANDRATPYTFRGAGLPNSFTVLSAAAGAAWAAWKFRSGAEPRIRAAVAISLEGVTDEGPADQQLTKARYAEEFAVQTALVRELFCNPFRPSPAIDAAWLAWQGGTVTQLAEAAYHERHLPEGALHPTRLALLADVLEDAGCTDAELLGHLRGQGMHVRGCWALDLISGRT
jgi:hypothetical protein